MRERNMLWLEAFHIIFVVTWFAGLFYLPRLFVYHTDVTDSPGDQRFIVMERRLLGITTIGGALAAAFGITLLVRYSLLDLGYLAQGWLVAKLILVAGLLGFHIACWRLTIAFRRHANRRSSRWYRAFNEVPTLFLIAIVVLAVVKPF